MRLIMFRIFISWWMIIVLWLIFPVQYYLWRREYGESINATTKIFLLVTVDIWECWE